MTKIGSRVGAMASADTETVRLYGYGTYVGDDVPTADAKGFGSMLHEAGVANPKIVLDNGKVVWGCECWLGSEEGVKNSIGDRLVVVVDIDEVRSKAEVEEG